MVILLQKTLLLFPPQFEPFPQRSAARHDTRCSTRCLGHIFCYVAQMSKMAIHGPKVTIWTLVLKIRWPLTTCFNQISMFNSINSCLESWKANHLQPLVGIQKCVTCCRPISRPSKVNQKSVKFRVKFQHSWKQPKTKKSFYPNGRHHGFSSKRFLSRSSLDCPWWRHTAPSLISKHVTI